MKKVLVTGGGGFIGLALVKALAKRNLEIIVLGRHRYPEVEACGAACITGDIRDKDIVSKSMLGCDTVFHVAAKAGIWGDYSEYYSINVQGTENVIKGCNTLGVSSLVYTSTPSVVFDGSDLEGVDETIPYASRPQCHYATTKILAEQRVLAANSANLKTVAIRPHLVWGPGDTNLIPRLVARGKEGKLRIVGDGKNVVDICYIDNVVHLHILAAENLNSSATAAGNAFFIGQQEPVMLWEWINDLFLSLNIKPVRKEISLQRAFLAGRFLEFLYGCLQKQQEPKMTKFLAEQLALSHWFDKGKAKNMLGYEEQVTTSEGMVALLKWLRLIEGGVE